MTDQWDRFAAGAERHLEALGFADSLDVYEPSVSYSTSDGYDVTYPGSADYTIDAEIVPPSVDSDRDESGTTTDADLVLYVDDGTGVTWTGYDESGTGDVSAAVEVELADGSRYAIADVEDQQDGLLRLEANEVET